MVRVIVTCEGFENIVYGGGVWLSTNGCYDWPSLVNKALRANGVRETQADCYLMGVPVDMQLTDLDILQNNDTLVFRPCVARADQRNKRVREGSVIAEDARRKVKRSEALSMRHCSINSASRGDQQSDNSAYTHQTETNSHVVPNMSFKSEEPGAFTVRKDHISSSPLPRMSELTQFSPSLFKHKLFKFLKTNPTSKSSGSSIKEWVTTTRHIRLSKIIELYQKYVEFTPTDKLYRAFIEEAGRGYSIYEDVTGELWFSHDPEQRQSRHQTALSDTIKGENNPADDRSSYLRSKSSIPAPSEARRSFAVGPHLSMNPTVEPDSTELLRLRLLYCVGPLAPRRAWFFEHIIDPYDNKVPLIVVAAHIQDSSKFPASAALLSQIINDALYISSLKSDYYRVSSDAMGKRIFQVLFLSPEEEQRLARKRSLGFTTSEYNRHLVATVASDKLEQIEGGVVGDCSLCRLIQQFLLSSPTTQQTTQPQQMVLSKSDSQSSVVDGGQSYRKNKATPPAQVDRHTNTESDNTSESQSSDESSSSSSSNTSSVDDDHGQVNSAIPSNDNVGHSSISDVPDSTVAQIRTCLAAISPGWVISVVEKLSSSSEHAGRSQDAMIRRHVGAMIGTSNNTLVLKNRFTNAMHCIPLSAILSIKDAASSDPCVLYANYPEERAASDNQVAATVSPKYTASCFDRATNEYISFPESLSEHPVLSEYSMPPLIKAGRNLRELNKWTHTEISILKQRIARQCAWYFSEKNLKTDKFLLSRLKAHNGKLPLKLLMSFNKIAALTNDESFVLNTLREKNVESSRVCIIEQDGDIFVAPPFDLQLDSKNDSVPQMAMQSPSLIPSVLLKRADTEAKSNPVIGASKCWKTQLTGTDMTTANPLVTISNPLLGSVSAMPAPQSSRSNGSSGLTRNKLMTTSANAETDCQSSEVESAGTLGVPRAPVVVPRNLIGARPRNAPSSLNF